MAHVNVSVDQLVQQAIECGAYFWLKAEGCEEQMASVIKRMQYKAAVDALGGIGIGEPTAAEMYAEAKRNWPAYKLHPAPEVA